MFLLFYLALRNQSWNQATGKLMIWSVGFLPNINEWQKFETIGGVEPSIEKAQILTDYILCLSTDRVLFCYWFFLTTTDFKWYMYETFSTKTSTFFSKRSNFVTKLYFLMDISHYFLYTFVYWNWLLFILLKLDHHKNKDTA